MINKNVIFFCIDLMIENEIYPYNLDKCLEINKEKILNAGDLKSVADIWGDRIMESVKEILKCNAMTEKKGKFKMLSQSEKILVITIVLCSSNL